MADRHDPAAEHDPTRVTNQPALTTVRPRWWYLWGGLFAAVTVGVLVWSMARQPVVAVIGVALIAVFYVGMLAAGATISAPRTRNKTLAWLMGGMAVTALVTVLTIIAIEWR